MRRMVWSVVETREEVCGDVRRRELRRGGDRAAERGDARAGGGRCVRRRNPASARAARSRKVRRARGVERRVHFRWKFNAQGGERRRDGAHDF